MPDSEYIGEDEFGGLMFQNADGTVISVPRELAPNGYQPPTDMSAFMEQEGGVIARRDPALSSDETAPMPPRPGLRVPTQNAMTSLAAGITGQPAPATVRPAPAALPPPRLKSASVETTTRSKVDAPVAEEKVDPDAQYRGEVDALAQEDIRAQQALTEAERSAARIESRGLKAMAATNMKLVAEEKLATMAAKEQSERDLAALADEVERIKAIEIKPNFTTGQKIASLATAGIAGWFREGDNNSVVDAINGLAAQQIDLQKANLANQVGMLEARTGLAREGRYVRQDDLEQRAKNRLAYLDAFMDEIKGQVSRFNDPAIQARGDQLINGIKKESAKTIHDLAMAREDREREAYEFSENNELAWADHNLDAKKYNDARNAAASGAPPAGIDPNDPRNVFDMSSGKPEFVGQIMGTEKEGLAFRENQEVATWLARRLSDVMKELEDGVTAEGGDLTKYIGTEKGRALRAKAMRIFLDAKVMMTGLAAPSAELKQIIEGYTVLPPNWAEVDPRLAMGGLVDELGEKLDYYGGIRNFVPHGRSFKERFRSMRPSSRQEDEDFIRRVPGASVTPPAGKTASQKERSVHEKSVSLSLAPYMKDMKSRGFVGTEADLYALLRDRHHGVVATAGRGLPGKKSPSMEQLKKLGVTEDMANEMYNRYSEIYQQSLGLTGVEEGAAGR